MPLTETQNRLLQLHQINPRFFPPSSWRYIPLIASFIAVSDVANLNALSELMKVLEVRKQRGIQDALGRELRISLNVTGGFAKA